MCFVRGQHHDGTRSCELLFLIRFHHVALFDVFKYLASVHMVNRAVGTQLLPVVEMHCPRASSKKSQFDLASWPYTVVSHVVLPCACKKGWWTLAAGRGRRAQRSFPRSLLSVS